MGWYDGPFFRLARKPSRRPIFSIDQRLCSNFVVIHRGLLVLLASLLFGAALPQAVRADVVVGTGMASDSTEAVLDTALPAGGSGTEPTPATGPAVIIGSGSGAPGQIVSIEVTIHVPASITAGVAGTQNRITFDPFNAPIGTVCRLDTSVPCSTDQDCITASGDPTDKCNQPDCTPNTAIKKESTLFIFLPSGCSGTACTGVRALVFSQTAAELNTPIPDASVLYRCNVNISQTATGGPFALTNSEVVMGQPANSGCERACAIPGAQALSGFITLSALTPTAAPPVVTNTFTATPTSTATATPTCTATATPTFTATATPTFTATVTPTFTATATATATDTAVSTSTPTPPACVGDCDGSRFVTVDEVLMMVNIALGNALVSSCTAGDANLDGKVTVDEILTSVNNALDDCSSH